MHFTALQLHSAMPIAWIFAGFMCLDFINPGLTRTALQVSSSDPVTMLVQTMLYFYEFVHDESLVWLKYGESAYKLDSQ